MNSIQVACKDGYNLADGYGNLTNGTAICQSNGLWNQQFYCFGKKECIYICIRMILLIYFNAQSLSNFSMDLKHQLEEYTFEVQTHCSQFVIGTGI